MESSKFVPQKNKIAEVVLLGICIHLLVLVAVLDVHFRSPLVVGLSPVRSTSNPPAKRTVLFLADGLRARSVFNGSERNAPFLTYIRKKKGSWGISRARFPTESRPCHMAILAGIYEDPSAIFKSWTQFPIEYDSVVNQSKNAWMIGYEGMIKLFGNSKRNSINATKTPQNLTKFKKENKKELDEWVFDRMESIFNESKSSERLRTSGNIFILFLSGLDITGHFNKPQSVEFSNHVKLLDDRIKKMQGSIKRCFEDQLTTFVFTSDHGMTDWGSHGSSTEEEVTTPFITWGAGIRKNSAQQDIDQVDIAPFLAATVGLNYPVNSLGRLPVFFFDLPKQEQFNLCLSNLEQVLKIFETKQGELENKAFFFQPYINISDVKNSISGLYIPSLERDANFFMKYDLIFQKIMDGIHYCDTYFVYVVFFSVSLGVLLWLLYLTTFLIPEDALVGPPLKHQRIIDVIFIISCFCLIVLGALQSFSFAYYLYILFPDFMIYLSLKEWHKIAYVLNLELSLKEFFKFLYLSGFVLIYIIAFHSRICFSLMMILVATSIFFREEKPRAVLRNSWILLCGILAVFPVLPVMFTKFHLIYYTLGFVTWQYFNFCAVIEVNHEVDLTEKLIHGFQNICFNLGFLVGVLIEKVNFLDRETKFIIYFAWILFLLPILIIPFSSLNTGVRIMSIFMGFAPFYIMTTMSFEMLFLTFFSALLIVWMKIEIEGSKGKMQEFENYMRSIIFVSLILIGYFGTGNIVNLNSFDPMWVRCFITSYRPFLITTLIMLKHMLPFLFAACAFRAIANDVKMNLTKCFCIILIVSDVLMFHFMFNINSTGSWADIGSSLGRFVIVDCFTIGILFFYYIAYILMKAQVEIDVISMIFRGYFLRSILILMYF